MNEVEIELLHPTVGEAHDKTKQSSKRKLRLHIEKNKDPKNTSIKSKPIYISNALQTEQSM